MYSYTTYQYKVKLGRCENLCHMPYINNTSTIQIGNAACNRGSNAQPSQQTQSQIACTTETISTRAL